MMSTWRLRVANVATRFALSVADTEITWGSVAGRIARLPSFSNVLPAAATGRTPFRTAVSVATKWEKQAEEAKP